MKINEKSLSAYSTSASPIDKEGYLCKRGELNKGYQKRWFVLKGNLLFYFEKKGDKEPIGVVILEGCSIELAENDDQFCFKIIFHGPNNRSYTLGSDSQESMEQWMKSLACASYDYMKFMVADLQRQLKELEGLPTINHEYETTMGSAQLPNNQTTQKKECSSKSSPQPPSRSRHNPFNKPTIARLVSQRKDIVSFKDLHNQLGRPILRDRNEWRFGLINQEPLIAL